MRRNEEGKVNEAAYERVGQLREARRRASDGGREAGRGRLRGKAEAERQGSRRAREGASRRRHPHTCQGHLSPPADVAPVVCSSTLRGDVIVSLVGVYTRPVRLAQYTTWRVLMRAG